MYCRKCGNKLKEDMRLCPQCGGSVDVINTLSKKSGLGEMNRINSMFSLIFSALPFLMFLIPLQVTTGSIWAKDFGSYLIIDGYDSFLQREMLSVWWGNGSEAISVINILILLISFVLVLLSLFATIKGTNYILLRTASVFLCAFFGLVYFLEGIVLVMLCDSSYKPITFSYIAVILVCFVIIAKFFLKKNLVKN